MATREIYESAKMNIPEGATGMRSWDGFTEFFSGSAKGGWRLICSNTPDVDSIPKSKPVIEIANQEKPKRVEVEYVKHNVNEDGGKFWEVARDWSEGEPCVFHYFDANSYWSIADNDRLLKEYENRNLYRRIKKEIDERQEFIERWASEIKNVGTMTYKDILGRIYDSIK